MYKLTMNGVTRLADGACIPPDPANRDYLEYLKWIEEGNTPQPEFTPEELETKAATEAANAAELADIETLRAEYSLTSMKELKIKQLQTAVRAQLSQAGGVNKAIEQLAIAVALLERKLYGKL